MVFTNPSIFFHASVDIQCPVSRRSGYIIIVLDIKNMNVKISCQQINDTVLGNGKSSILFCVFVQFDNTVNDNVSVRTAFRIENIKEVWWNYIKQSEQLSVPSVCSCIFYQNRINSYIYYFYIYYLFLLFIFFIYTASIYCRMYPICLPNQLGGL